MAEVQTTEDEFQQHLRDFHELFHSKQDAVHSYIAEVVKICNAALSAANIRHTPITSRVKSWKSAKGSVMRRQQERLLYSQSTTVEPVWVEYYLSKQLEQRNIRPFQSGKEMFEGLHDIGGVRIPLYFPGDVAKVIGVLKSHLHVLRVTEKGQDQPNARLLKGYLNELNPTTTKKPGGYERTFGGYKATHIIVRLQDTDIPEAWQNDWKDIVVEIQLGTLVMHLWSEIEHDMIYKPLQSQGNEISEEEARVLDLINGIVMTGEAALRQLEISMTRRLSQRAKDQAAFASSQYELVFWIENYYKDMGKPLVQGKWKLLEELYEVLKINDDHKLGRVEELLERIGTPDVLSREELPSMILEILCADPGLGQPPSISRFGQAEDQIIAHARFWGLRLIQSLNVAMYLGVTEQFVNLSGIKLTPPPLTNFLDLMHPYSPYPLGASRAGDIAEYCQKIISQNQEGSRLQRVSANLPQTGRTVSADSAQGAHQVVVPGMLSKLFPAHDDTQTDPLGLLDFIHDYARRDEPGDVGLVLWDRLTSAGRGRAKQRPLELRAFVSQAPPWDRGGAWRLEDLRAESKPAKWDAPEGGEAKPTPVLPHPGEDHTAPGIVGLAYRLHHPAQWENVRKAWKVAEALRPAARPGKGGDYI